jgi:hypothetical protein
LDAAEVMVMQTRSPALADSSWPSFRHVSDAIDAPFDDISSD